MGFFFNLNKKELKDKVALILVVCCLFMTFESILETRKKKDGKLFYNLFSPRFPLRFLPFLL